MSTGTVGPPDADRLYLRLFIRNIILKGWPTVFYRLSRAPVGGPAADRLHLQLFIGNTILKGWPIVFYRPSTCPVGPPDADRLYLHLFFKNIILKSWPMDSIVCAQILSALQLPIGYICNYSLKILF